MRVQLFEALRYMKDYKGTITYVEINSEGLAIVKWQKDTIYPSGKPLELGTKPTPFGESVYFSDQWMTDSLSYGTVDSNGKRLQIEIIDRLSNNQYKNAYIVPIDGEKRIDANPIE
ncbi:hypothetical protein [Ammoniphilus resinae]|nr:hypothetical protein [Ammoniphilus resinae]